MIECPRRYFRLFVCLFVFFFLLFFFVFCFFVFFPPTQTTCRIFGCTASGDTCLTDSTRTTLFSGPMAATKWRSKHLYSFYSQRKFQASNIARYELREDSGWDGAAHGRIQNSWTLDYDQMKPRIKKYRPISVYVELQKYAYVPWKHSCGCTVKSYVLLPNWFSVVSAAPVHVVFIILVSQGAVRYPPYSEFWKGPQAIAYLGCTWIRHWVRCITERKAESTAVKKTT
jgi:hypothetical protein